jgi:nucleotide-binding universal stress UspA family protein
MMTPRPDAPPERARPRSILVGYDFSEHAVLALEEGIALALARGPATLHVVSVDDGMIAGELASPADRGARAAAIQEATAGAVENALARRGGPGLRVVVHGRVGMAAEELLALAGEIEAGAIVVGTHGRRGLERWIFGSVAERIAREARCPVIVVRPLGYPEAPGLEPACPECTIRREQTHGAEPWCAVHARAWDPPHRYVYTDAGINRLRPDEWALW